MGRARRLLTASPQRVAIVVPLSARVELTADEKVSMRHLCHYLGRYDKYLIAPQGAAMIRDDFRTLYFPRKFFGSAAAHNRLLMWPRFYRAFVRYDFILVYHLDSLVFSDELTRWCEAGVDYIGAPWVPCDDTPWVKQPNVGNGGFTLMNIERVLQVLRRRHRLRWRTIGTDLVDRNERVFGPLFATVEALHRRVPGSRILARVAAQSRRNQNPAAFGCNNDFFWSFEAVRYLPTFRVATVEQGLRFAFEAAPRLCFELNQRQLPFGCHAWAKFDREFWEPHLLPANTRSTRRLADMEPA